MTEEEELELIEIELELRKRKPPASEPDSIPVSKESGSGVPDSEGILSVPGKIMDKMQSEAEQMKAIGWERMTPGQRFESMMLSVPGAIKKSIFGAEQIAERSAGPVIGQSIGRAIPIPAMDRLLGAIGGAAGEALAEKREGSDLKPGRIASAALSGAVRGRGLAGAGASEVGREAAKYGAVGLAGKTAETITDEGRLPTAEEALVAGGASAAGAPIARALSVSVPAARSADDALNAMRDQSFRDVRKWGIVVPPSELGRGSDTIASVGGKAATQQQAAKRNQFGWQRAAREDIGLSGEALPISRKELLSIREEAGAPYREIQTIQREAEVQLQDRLRELAKESDPHAALIKMEEPAMKESLSILTTLAAADVDALKESRKAAQNARRAFFAGDPKSYETWQRAKAESESLEGAIERAAASLRDDSLLNRLKESRRKIAKTYSVEEAVNPGNGFVDPAEFGRQLLNGEALSGNLEKIAKFQLAFRREAVEAGRVPAPGVGNIGAMATTGMASRGDVPGVIGAVVNATAGRPARAFLLSDMVQDSMLSPRERQNLSAVMARYVAENTANEVLEEDREPGYGVRR